MKVLWLTFIPSPYRCNFFSELGKKCDLTVLFERETSKYRGNNWDDFAFEGYKGIILNGITIGSTDRLCMGLKKYLLDKSYDIIVISNPTSPTGILAAHILKTRKISYIVESDGAFPSENLDWKNKIKKYVMSSAEICMSTSDLHDKYYVQSGVEIENIRRYPFTSLYAKDIEKEILSSNEKRDLRKKLGIDAEKMVISVGRLIPGKGFDVLLKAWNEINDGYELYIIGGTPSEEYTNLIEEQKKNSVHFVEFMNSKELKKYYLAADLFVLPTRSDVWGLVINEAMACALPVITTDKCIAGIELVDDKENGFIVECDNTSELACYIKNILEDDKLRESMNKNSLNRINDYTYEKMVEVHMTVFEEYKKRG